MLAVVLLAGCATSETRGALLRTDRLKDDCEQAILRGELGTVAAGHVALKISDLCASTEVDVFATRRYTSPHWVPTALIALGAAGVVTVGIVAGLASLPSTHPANTVAHASSGSVLRIIPGLVVGGVVAIAIGAAQVDLPHGEERVPHRTGIALRPVARATLRSKDAPSVEWPVENGQASLPLEVVRRLDLNRLELDGRPVELGEESLRRSDALDSCRIAVEGWSRGGSDVCPAQQRRMDAAQRCSEGGWTFAVEVEQVLSASLVACSHQ